MTKPNCPTEGHFHVFINNAVSEQVEHQIICVDKPEKALDLAIASLPNNWVGGIEVTDDETLAPDGMPLIDYWHEPIKTV